MTTYMASGLLAGAVADGAAERAVLAVTQAEVAVNRDFWCRTGLAPLALDQAAASVAEAPGDARGGFDLDLLRLRGEYADELFGLDEAPSGPEGRDPAVAAGLADRARRMWERSAEQRQRAGAVPYVLSQQLLLAGLARDGGDEAAARGLAAEVRRWAGAHRHCPGPGSLTPRWL